MDAKNTAACKIRVMLKCGNTNAHAVMNKSKFERALKNSGL